MAKTLGARPVACQVAFCYWLSVLPTEPVLDTPKTNLSTAFELPGMRYNPCVEKKGI